MKFRVTKHINESAFLAADEEKVLWHCRFGHVSSDLINKIEGIPFVKKLNVSMCETCA